MSRQSCPEIEISKVFASLEAAIAGDASTVITGLTQDSRSVQPGDLYCSVRGRTFDGHQFIGDAIQRGAVAVVVDAPIENIEAGIAVITVNNVREALGVIAGNAFSHPASSLTMVGITGTNGKTSTAEILASILRASGHTVAVFGTLTGERTTPEAIDLHAQLADVRDAGVTHVVMEVSSHALDQSRVRGIEFAVGILTNITRDHLDYHGTEENYFAAKAKLFAPGVSRVGVVNTDDLRGRLLFDVGAIPMRSYSSEDAVDPVVLVSRVEFTWNGVPFSVPMGGRFTLMNALAAITAADELKISREAMVAGCASLEGVPGRFESVPNDVGVGIVVDYAHTPDGLIEVLNSARALATDRVIVVFGCGGNRDHGKRPLMGEVAHRLADVVYVTSDNPRTENPSLIIDDVLAGMPSNHGAIAIVDRAEAIASAIFNARRGDIVVIAGKGHESTQDVGGVLTPFSDVDVARSIVEKKEGGRA